MKKVYIYELVYTINGTKTRRTFNNEQAMFEYEQYCIDNGYSIICAFGKLVK